MTFPVTEDWYGHWSSVPPAPPEAYLLHFSTCRQVEQDANRGIHSGSVLLFLRQELIIYPWLIWKSRPGWSGAHRDPPASTWN